MALKKQMELFSEGGLEQDGGTTDPVSGNDVPPGSTQEEVRDDIPAQLSEGEFVFPADVVRYVGLENLMRMRQEAKMGLKMMDKMGQMGNSEEATIPDDIPFDLSDLDIDNEKEYNVGGFVPATPQQQQFGISGFQQSAISPTVSVPTPPVQFSAPSTYTPPQQAQVPVAPVPNPQPEFQNFLGNLMTKNVEYINPETGERRVFTFINGQPTVEIPAGFIPLAEYEKKTQTASTEVMPTTVDTTSVRAEDDNDPPSSPEEVAEMKARVNAAKRLGITELASFSLFGKYGPEDEGKFTPTGYIIGKNGVLLDPLTGTIREQGSPFPLTGIIDAIAGKAAPVEPGYSQDFFDAMPDQAKDNLGRSLGADARNERLETAAQRRQSFEDRLREMQTITRADDIDDEERGIDRAVDVARTNRASLRAQIARERQDEIRQTKNDIATVQAQARAEIASRDNRQQAAERAQREARERQEDRNEGGSGQTIQEKADSYTADRVSEAIATGDFSRGFAEGGLASKKKPKAKKMKRGGLASKK